MVACRERLKRQCLYTEKVHDKHGKQRTRLLIVVVVVVVGLALFFLILFFVLLALFLAPRNTAGTAGERGQRGQRGGASFPGTNERQNQGLGHNCTSGFAEVASRGFL